MRSSIMLGLILGFVALAPSYSHADFPRVCRGGSLYKYDNEIKKAVKEKLRAADIAFKRVDVSYSNVNRTRSRFENDFADDLTVASGETPAINFTGAFPDLSTCTITFNLKITVVYPDNTKAITITSASAPGTLLPPLGRGADPKDE